MVRSGIDAEDLHCPLRRALQSGEQTQQRGFPGSVGTEETGDARLESHVDLGNGHFLAKPFGKTASLDGGGHACFRYRR